MIKKLTDIVIAEYHALDQVIEDEVQTADLVVITAPSPGGIYHSTHMKWRCNLEPFASPTEVIGSKKERKAIAKNIEYFQSLGYTFQIQEMNEADFAEFQTLYAATTQKKTRAIAYETRDKVLGRIVVGIPVYCVGMYKGTSLESALLFTINQGKQAIVSFGAKKIFPNLRGGVGGILEWNLLKYCFEHAITQIEHGKNANPIGLTAKSGLFEFKARYGNSAFPDGEWVTTYLLNPAIVLSDLVFVHTIGDVVGYTIVSNTPAEEIGKKYQTKITKNVTLRSLESVVQEARLALQQK